MEYAQENYFFDGANDELRKAENLRIRFYDGDQKAVITIKVCLMAMIPTMSKLCCADMHGKQTYSELVA